MVSVLDARLQEWAAEAASIVATGPWIEGGSAALAVLLLTPIVIRLARRNGHIDAPSDARWHHRPVALMGGVAIVAGGAIVGIGTGAYSSVPGLVWMGFLLVFGAGLLDDVWSISPVWKLVAQGAAAVCVIASGVAFWSADPAWVSIPLTGLWVVGVVNAMNLIDGLDGLAAGIAAIAAGLLGAMAWLGGDGAIAAIAGTTAGASAAFLAFNAPPARVFMGDCGSMALGYVLAVLALIVPDAPASLSAAVAPALVLAVPLFDTTFVTVTRLQAGRSVLEGGTDHVHHRLAILWGSERGAVLTLHGATLVTGGLAVAVYGSSVFTVALVGGGVAAAAVLGGLLLVRATEPRVHRDRLRRILGRGDGATQDGDAIVRPSARTEAPPPTENTTSSP